MSVAAEATAHRSRRRPRRSGASSQASVPYLLILPVIVVITAILGYPLYKLVTLSFQQYGLPELIQRKGVWIGFDNYSSVLRDEIFWRTLLRTVIFTAANVGADDRDRHADRVPARPGLVLGACAAHRRARARLVDAGGRRRAGLVSG